MTRPPLLDWLTSLADEEQLSQHPLPEHAAAGQDEHLRRHYALLLAAALSAQPQVSETQSRLLRLLLQSLGLGDIRAALFEAARALDAARLAEALRLLREAGLAEHLLVDLMVLLRLDAPLNDDAVHLLGELAATLDVDEATLHRRASDAAAILGLEDDEDDEDDEDGENNNLIASLIAEHWPGALPQPLTAEALRAGLNGGLWVVDSDLKVNFAWQAQNAALVFRNGAQLNTSAQGAVSLAGCRLVNARLVFTGGAEVTLERVHWQGQYAPDQEITALASRGNPLTVRDARFHTPGARAILCENARLSVTGSQFERCGYSTADGGAIWHSNNANSNSNNAIWHSNNDRQISGCRFEACAANKGGAVYVNLLYGIHDCEFIACRSVKYGENVGGDIAVFAKENRADPVITGCIFRRCSLSVGHPPLPSFFEPGITIARDCQFIDGNLYHYGGNHQHTLAANCHFHHGAMIERGFE